jgi:hypothetical protein
VTVSNGVGDPVRVAADERVAVDAAVPDDAATVVGAGVVET